MKLIDLTVGSTLYDIDLYEYKISSLSSEVEKEVVKISIKLSRGYEKWQEIKHPLETSASFCVTSGYLSYRILYTTPQEAANNKMAEVYKELKIKLDSADLAVKIVQEHRQKYWNELNSTDADELIEKLKKSY